LVVKAYILVRVESGKDLSVMREIEALGKMYAIKDIDRVFGSYDLIIEVEMRDQPCLETFVFDALRQIPGVRETTTLISARKREMT
jgi:DNA-binding Lrp family transcriptional regulator